MQITAKNKNDSEVMKILDQLGKIGVRVDFDENTIDIDLPRFRKATNRNAGRKAQSLKVDGEFKDISVEEVRLMMKRDGAEQVAKYLGISKRNLYYRLKEAEETGASFIY